MNKKIKVIELFDIIAKGIDIPVKVEYEDKLYIFDSKVMDYVSRVDSTALSLIVIGNDNLGEALDREVEILEDEKEINIKEIKEFPVCAIEAAANDENMKLIAYKINDLVKAVKQLDKKINKED